MHLLALLIIHIMELLFFHTASTISNAGRAKVDVTMSGMEIRCGGFWVVALCESKHWRYRCSGEYCHVVDLSAVSWVIMPRDYQQWVSCSFTLAALQISNLDSNNGIDMISSVQCTCIKY
jgi:hypothetical protein